MAKTTCAIELVNGVKEAIANCDINAVKMAGDAFINAMVTVDSVSNPLYVRKSDIMQFIKIFMGDGEITNAALDRQRRDDLVTISQDMFEDFIYQNTSDAGQQTQTEAQAETVETAVNSEQTAAQNEQNVETATEQVKEEKKMTINDYAVKYWTKELATTICKLAVKNAGNNYQQDFISHFVLRSCVFEALTGLRATEWKDKVKVVNLKEGSSQWKICDLLARRWSENYAQAQGDKGYRINSQVMVYVKGDCEYRYTPEKGSTIRYRLVRNEKLMIDLNHNKKYTLTADKYSAVDKNCKFYR